MFDLNQMAYPEFGTMDLAEHSARRNVFPTIVNPEILVDSIRENGIIDPLSIVQHEGQWLVLDGMRRLEAAKLAGLETVPCFIQNVGSTFLDIEVRIIELNIQKQKTYTENYQLIVKLLERFPNRRGKRTDLNNEENKYDRYSYIAELMDCGRTHVLNIKNIGDNSLALLGLVDKGEKTISQVLKELKANKDRDPEKQKLGEKKSPLILPQVTVNNESEENTLKPAFIYECEEQEDGHRPNYSDNRPLSKESDSREIDTSERGKEGSGSLNDFFADEVDVEEENVFLTVNAEVSVDRKITVSFAGKAYEVLLPFGFVLVKREVA